MPHSRPLSDLRSNSANMFDSEIYHKLKEAELEAKNTSKRFLHDEVFSTLRRKAQAKATEDV
ncbi:MAG: hypothetical protein KGZ64_12445 [Thermaerobacter sp.]|nr:hypothetical protein [Thermaerobacter sp.]